MLVTKHTRKKQNYNKQYIAKKIDNLADSIAKRGVYVIKKTSVGYNIVNYMNNNIIVEDIPFLKTAKSVVKEYNRSKNVNEVHVINLNKYVDRYFKQYNDMLFYRNTIQTSKDAFKIQSANSRLKETLMYFRDTKEYLLNY